MGSINNGGGGGGANHIIDAFGRLLTCVLRHMASELNLMMRKDELNLSFLRLLLMTRAIMSSAHTKDQSFGVIEVFLGLQVHGMLSQMDPALDIKLNRGIHDALASEEAFFQSHPKAKAPELSTKKLFGDLPRLWHRVKAPHPKDAAQLALKKMPSAEQEIISMGEYQQGVGAWIFDLEDLKFKASLVQDDDEIQDIRDHDVDSTSFANNEASNSKATTIGKHSTSDIESRSMFILDEVVPSESLINKESKLPKTDDKGSIIVEEKSRKETKKPQADKEAAVAQSAPLVAAIVLNHSKSGRTCTLERCETESSQFVDKIHHQL
ncbi:unnamed protein product [Lactuca saligna]|uniref:Uncharacterized protein n=1 Tax=Lactuca saligna TaxID=75948 RepID=A0AA35ZYP9_LACSI|nr:unnamed protein product [Lactuca saligna]